jgi:hypothetical protein
MNLAQIKFNYMIVDIQEKQRALESESQRLVDRISAQYLQGDFSRGDVNSSTGDKVTALLSHNVASVRDSFLQLFDDLMFKYADGWINSWSSAGFSSQNTGVPV